MIICNDLAQHFLSFSFVLSLLFQENFGTLFCLGPRIEDLEDCGQFIRAI